MKTRIISLFIMTLLFSTLVNGEIKDPQMKANEEKALAVKPFDLEDVRLLEGPFKHAQDLSGQSLMNYNPDRLLANFRIRAGLEPKAEAYGGWESQSLMGHSLGHYLSALSLMYASTGEQKYKDRVEYIVNELDEVQKANGDGYLMCVPRGKELFKEISEGQIQAERFNLNGCWAPYYTMHKIMSGLRDAYRICSNEKALEVETKLADWLYGIIDDLTDEKMQQMMYCEHGGIAESLADLAADTGNKKYMDMAIKFHHKEMWDPMIEQRDILPGYHANTQIPKFIAMARIYELTGDEKYKRGAEFSWDRVANHHSYVTGGNGLNEHFGEPDKLNDRLGINTTETCNVYNILKLTKHLFCQQPRANVADFYERALYNHILSSQHPEDGRVIYNLTLEMGGAKNYQNPEGFTCCVGTGMENHSKYGDSIYFHNDNELYVNLFIASQLNWEEKGLKLTQNTKFPEDDKIKLTFNCENPVELTVLIRHPYWAKKGVEVSINGQKQELISATSGYIKLHRTWNDGDIVDIRIPMTLRLESMPDNPERVAIMYGPLVLAGELGEENDPNAGDTFFIPVLVTNDRPVEGWVKDVEDKSDTFMLDSVGRPRDVELYPFCNMHEKRYTIFWDIFSEGQWAEKVAEFERIQREKRDLEERTIDLVQPGDEQSEQEHNLQYQNSNTGRGRRSPPSRSAFNGGWFSYDIKGTDQPLVLRVTYSAARRGQVVFDVFANDTKIAEQQIERTEDRQPVVIDYKLSDELTEGKDKITVKFAAQTDDGRIATVTEIRILKEKQ